MKLEVGMYVRTNSGLIAKYIGYEREKYIFDNDIYWMYEYYNDYIYEEDFEEWFKEKEVKTSHNIIDLIEIGDYVNGDRIDEIENGELRFHWDYEYSEYCSYYKNEDIKSIVTKEQMASMSYKVGE